MAEYEQELARWNTVNDARKAAIEERAKLESEISALESTKPTPPIFEERTWSTSDGKYTTNAVLVDTDFVTATLRKADGQTTKVPRETLVEENRIYIDKAVNSLNAYRGELAVWERNKGTLEDQFATAMAQPVPAEIPEPQKPLRQEVMDEVATADAEKKERERLARVEEARQVAEAAARKA